MSSLIQAAGVALPAMTGAETPAWFGADRILGFLLVLVMILIVVTGIAVIAKAKQGNWRQAGNAGFVVLIGVLIIAAGVSGVVWVVAEGGLDLVVTSTE